MHQPKGVTRIPRVAKAQTLTITPEVASLAQQAKHPRRSDNIAKQRRQATMRVQSNSVRQTEDTDLLDALEGAPAGFPIAPSDLIAEARTRIAEKNHPELGELAALQSAYEFAIGVTEQMILAAGGLTKMELVADRTPAPKDTRQAYVLSTGQAV